MDYICEKICLSKPTRDIFEYYGGVEKSVNKILDMASEGQFELLNKPRIENRNRCSYLSIKIYNQDYIMMKKLYPENSSKLSLRRLCEWFVSNEMYFDWKPEPPELHARTYVKDNYTDHLIQAQMELIKAIRFCRNDNRDKLVGISKQIGDLLK